MRCSLSQKFSSTCFKKVCHFKIHVKLAKFYKQRLFAMSGSSTPSENPFRKRRFRKLLFNRASAVTASTDTFCDGSWRQFYLRWCRTLEFFTTRAYMWRIYVRVEMSGYLLTYLPRDRADLLFECILIRDGRAVLPPWFLSSDVSDIMSCLYTDLWLCAFIVYVIVCVPMVLFA